MAASATSLDRSWVRISVATSKQSRECTSPDRRAPSACCGQIQACEYSQQRDSVWQLGYLLQAPLQEALFGRIVGECHGLFVGFCSISQSTETAQEVGARGMKEVIAVQVPGILKLQEPLQTFTRTGNHGEGKLLR